MFKKWNDQISYVVDFFIYILFNQMEGKLAASQIPHVSPFLRVIYPFLPQVFPQEFFTIQFPLAS